MLRYGLIIVSSGEIQRDQRLTYGDVDGLHAVARGVLRAEVLDFLVQHGRVVVHQVDHDVDAVVDAQQVRAPLRAVRLVHFHAVTLEQPNKFATA